jgi:spiro-SPASM protein
MSKTAVMCVSLLNTKYSLKPFKTGKTSVEIVCANIDKYLKGFDVINFISSDGEGETYKKCFNTNTKTGSDIYSLLSAANNAFKDWENIIIIHTGNPLSVVSEAKRLLKLHEDNLSDYTYCENYPLGMGIEIVSKDTLAKLSMIASGNNKTFSADSIFELINFDINSYDIEIDIAPKDVRRDRLEINTQNKRNYLICNKILEYTKSDDISFEKLYAAIKENPEIMRSLPAYIEIEVTGACNLSCVMCPRENARRNNEYMKLDDFKKIIDDISDYTEDIHVCLSGMGEPFLHQDIIEMISYASSKKSLTLFVETSGVNLNKEIADKLFDYRAEEVYIIFSIDASEKELYDKIRPGSDFSSVEKNIDYFMSKNKDRAFLQFVKTGINENNLDNFYLRWKNYEERIIIIKYNDFRGELEKDRSHNLSPIQRFPCWHLKRDLYITSKCEAVFCKQDYKGEKLSLNVLETGIEGAFDKLEDFYKIEYKDFPLEYCKDCDEYFTYNF